MFILDFAEFIQFALVLQISRGGSEIGDDKLMGQTPATLIQGVELLLCEIGAVIAMDEVEILGVLLEEADEVDALLD